MDFLNLLEGESESLFFANFNLVRASQSLESISGMTSRSSRSIGRSSSAVISVAESRKLNSLSIACRSERSPPIDVTESIQFFMTNFPLRVPSPTDTLHLTPTEKTHSAVCALLISTRRFSTFFLCFFGDTA